VSKKRYEIIVVKNFTDEYIDRKLEELGIINVNTAFHSLGEKIVIGVDKAQGNIISILEDDDLFLPNKIEKVLKMFNNYNIGYYHNSYVHIDTKQRILGYPIKLNKPLLLIQQRDKQKYVDKLIFKYYSIYNNSFISIDKSIIIKNKNYIKNFTYALDIFLFYAGIASDKGIYFDTEVLTKQRIHKLNSKVRDDNFESWLLKMRDRLKISIKEFTLISEFLKEQNISSKFVNFMISDRKICLARLPNECSPKENLGIKDILNYIDFHRKSIRDILQLLLIFAPKKFRLDAAKRWYETEVSL
jgi:hypothetical protein